MTIVGFFKLPRKAACALIRLYQKTLSFDHGPLRRLFPYGYCRYYPTCSEYGHQAINKYGALRGGFMALWRIIRCNPLSRGGNDPVR